MFQNNDLFKMNLQLFGEDEPQEPQTDTPAETQQERMFTQAEMDAAIANRLSRYKRDEDKRIEEAKQAARSEAEKLAKMNAEQRAEHDRQEAERAAKAREDEITRREAELTRRELKATAMDELSKRKLPGGLLDILNYSDADACNASIATVEKAWRECVQQGVNERLAQSGVSLRTSTGNQPDPDKMTDDEWFAWRKSQRQQKG